MIIMKRPSWTPSTPNGPNYKYVKLLHIKSDAFFGRKLVNQTKIDIFFN